jgi:isohexenylglutaconyl-CoA hydratase
MPETLVLHQDAPFARITLNRPEARNAMDFAMVDELITAFTALGRRDDIRAVVIDGAGEHFCSRSDLGDLQLTEGLGDDQADAIVARLDHLLRMVQNMPQVVITRVHGAALGGGLGLVCVSDIAIAAADAQFGLPEVRFGLAASVILPYVVARIGRSRASVVMLTGARFDGVSAHEYGLVHEVCPASILDACVDAILGEIGQCAPAALRTCKALLASAEQPPDGTLALRVRAFNRLHASAEAREGVAALLEQRPPAWAIHTD